MFYAHSIYLDLGGALAAFGLIFAVYQLRKPQWDLVLRLRNRFQRNLFWILGVVGLLLIFIRVLLFELQIITSLPYPFNRGFIYEMIAYLFFIASPISLIYFSTRAKNLFHEKNARKFYEVLVFEISKTNDTGANTVLEVLLYNFRNICKNAVQRKGNNEASQSAMAILDVVLSDESVVKVLTTKRLDALQFIFSVIKEHNVSRREAGIGISKIVQNLFYDKDSFFYKHLNRDGLALSLNIYECIFGSHVILTNFDLFKYPTLEYSRRKKIDIEGGIKVFIEALSQSIKTYLKTGKVPPRHINSGLSYLSDIFGDLCLKISIEEKRGVDTKYSLKDEWWALHLIANFLGHDYPFLAYQEEVNKEVIEREKTTTEADFYSNYTINSGIAAALYKAFEQLSYIENTANTYDIVLELLYGIMHEEKLKEGYRNPFEKRIWQQIGINIVRRYYPAVLRVYLEFIGFCLASNKDQGQGWIGKQTEKMRRLLYIDLKPLIDNDEVMINKEKIKDALLPKSMDYRRGKFIYRFEFGRGKEKEIAPPPDGVKSVLDDVDLEQIRLI